MTPNPLLQSINTRIAYSDIEPAHIEQAIPTLIDHAKKAVDAAADPALPLNWESFVEPLLDATEPLSRAWSIASHLNAVVNTPALREAYNACLPKITEYSTWTSLHEGLYEQYKRFASSAAFKDLTATRQRIIELALRDFRLGGAELTGTDRSRYKELSDESAQASQQFAENTLDSVDEWALIITDKERLKGLPDDVIASARTAAEKDGKAGYKLVLQMPCYLPVMQYAEDRALRHELYKAYATMASEFGKAELDNSPNIENLLRIRAEQAQLLGYPTFSDRQLETRMAKNSQEVMEFLQELAEKSLPYAHHDYKELKQYALTELNLDELQPWDVGYVSEKLRQERYDFSQEEVKQYFTEPNVLAGLFSVVNTLFGVTMRPTSASTWHEDVKAFEVVNDANQVQGLLYIDLYARQGKRSGAWVGSERERRQQSNGLRTPVVYLTCNFTPPHGDRPSLLTHDDVITLFHESGHAFHCLLSQVDDPDASAFAAVEWDAIELPSQFMENFCWEWPVIKQMSRHVDTGASLPRSLFNKMLAAKNFQSGMLMVRQLEFALFDMEIHRQGQGLSIQEVLATLDRVRQQVAVIKPPHWHRFPHHFSHLFAGGYAAGYYSYKWAEVLSADTYAAFEEEAIEDDNGERTTLVPNTGKRFLNEVLAVGGIRPAADSFKAFRGREPSINALLKHSGMAA